MTFPSTVIPAYPYEGGLYWLLGEGSVRHEESAKGPGYYRNVYGIDPTNMARQASALAALFEDIELAPVDHALPDLHAYTTASGYRHPELRLSRSEDIGEWAEDARELTRYLLENKPNLTKILDHSGHTDPFAKEQFIARLILQARLAVRRDAVLVGDELFEAVYQIVLPSMGAFIEGWPLESERPISLAITSRLLNAIGLFLPSPTYDIFCSIRESSEISEYANGFRNALGMANGQGDLERSLLSLMREAREKSGVAKRLAGAMQASGSWSGIVGGIAGALPGVGTVTSLVGLGSDLVNRRTEASSKRHGWYTFGSKLQEVSLNSVLDRCDP
ncbi:hypothetical protein [Burkholderia lata]|uniref:hypothetical protein n=1 Tax=Burkholderia lata (strain ATCC 17760 / DSM 23089 / LMG 22485 / NCIMB 9086 / R18194 / 383) TaxID=482957 RepID=UPI0012E9EBD5|nr:hypothetical protein [Burkholderia lata]